MSTSTKRLRTAMVAAGVAAMTLIPATAPSVLAACAGTGNPYASSSGWGYENAQNLTCDNLSDYNGLYRDTVLDGLRVRIRYINNVGVWTYTNYTDGLNINYYYGYSDADKNTQFRICRSDGVCGPVNGNWGF